MDKFNDIQNLLNIFNKNKTVNETADMFGLDPITQPEKSESGQDVLTPDELQQMSVEPEPIQEQTQQQLNVANVPQQDDPISKINNQIQIFEKLKQQKLDAARGMDDDTRLLNNLNKAFSQINKGLSEQSGQVKVNPQAIDIDAIEEARALKDLDIEQQQKQQEMKNAIMLQDRMLRQQQLDATNELRKQNQERQQGYLDQKRAQEDRLLNNQYVNTALNFLDRNSVYKKVREQEAAFDNVDRLLDQVKTGNSSALPALGTQMARAMGEVGVLTDADVTRYLQRSDWGGKVIDWMKKGMEGTLDPSTAKQLAANINAIRSSVKNKQDKIKKEAYDRFMSIYPDSDKTGAITGLIGLNKDNNMQQEPKMAEQSNNRSISKKLYSPSRNQTKILYSDGSEEILEGKQ